MSKDAPETLTIEDCELTWRNFEGREGPFNDKGERNFSVVLTPAMAEQFAKDGLNVKVKDPREEGDDPKYTLPVKVSYKIRPPRAVMITSTARTDLHEDTIEVLDFADIAMVDLIVNLSDWEYAGKTGIKCYLKTIFVTVNEDDLERKYAINDMKGE